MRQDELLKEQQELVIKNLKLVYHLVNKLHVKNEQYDDIVSIGTVGLTKAAMTFDKSKGIAFSTYASRCINNEILMYFRSEKKHGKLLSLDEPISRDSEDNEITLDDMLPNPESYFTEEFANKDLVTRLISIILNLLETRERLIMLYKISGMNQQSIAKKLNISRSYVSRIETTLKKEIESYLTTVQQYKEVFQMAIVGDSYKISFSSKDVVYFNKIFATFLENVKSAETLPDFKIVCNKERIIVFVPAHPQSFSFVAQIIREIDDYTVSFEKKISANGEVTSEINSPKMVNKVEEKDSVETVEEDKKEEVENVTDKSDVENSEETLNEPSQQIISDNLSTSIEADKKSVVKQKSKERKGSKVKQVRDYMLTLDTFTAKELKEHFPEETAGTIANALYLAKSNGLIVSFGKGKYATKKD